MRTLNKTLSLVLALVLCLGLVGTAFAANYDKYTDAETVGAAYKEAVDVMLGTGIINGMSATEIGATGTLTREQAAKIVAYMVLGQNLADALKADKAPFKDVAADRWSAGYIAYCAKAGILAGYGDGKFGPTDELTGFQFAKMLLIALGFKGEYTGEGWAIAVAQDAIPAGLFAGDEAAASNAALERQQAMLLGFNGLNYSKTTAVKYVVKNTAVTPNVEIGTFDTLVEAYLVANSNANYNYTGTKEIKTGSLGAKNYGLLKTTKTDAFGRTSVAYTNGKEGKAEVVYSKTAATPVKTYTAATTVGKIMTDLGYTKVADTATANVYDNTATKATTTYAKNDTTTAVGGQGTLVEVYKAGTDVYNVVIVNTYAKVLAEGNIIAAVKADATHDAAPAYVWIDLDGDTTKDAGELFENTAAFKKGDVVLYTAADGKIQTMVAPEFVSGKVTATAAGYFKVDGEKMVLAACAFKDVPGAIAIGTDAGYKIDAVNSYTYYKDAYGNVVYAKAGVTAPVATNYTFVVKTASKAAGITGTGENLFDVTPGSAAAAQAQIIDLATGELKIVDVAVAKGTDGKYYYADAQGKAGATEVGANNVPATPKSVYTYTTLESGAYVFGATAFAGESVTVEKGKATGVSGKIMNSATVLNVVEYTTDAKTSAITGAAVTTTTGIANFPASAVTYTGAIVAAGTNNVVNTITVVKAKAAAVATTKYAIFNGVGETDATGTKYGFYVGGELVEYYAPALSFTKGDVVSYKLTNGKIAAAADVSKQTALASAKVVTAVDETFVACGSDVYYFAKTGVEIYNNTTKAATTIAVGDTIAVYGADANNIAFVLVSAQ